MELHFVHTYPDGSLGAVVGIFFDRELGGDHENFFVEQMLPVFESHENHSKVINTPMFISSFLRSLDTNDFWHYDGSLTTPPCTEGIKWTLLKSVQPISARQLKYFNDMWKDNHDFAEGRGNNREVQPLNGRKIFYRMP